MRLLKSLPDYKDYPRRSYLATLHRNVSLSLSTSFRWEVLEFPDCYDLPAFAVGSSGDIGGNDSSEMPSLTKIGRSCIHPIRSTIFVASILNSSYPGIGNGLPGTSWKGFPSRSRSGSFCARTSIRCFLRVLFILWSLLIIFAVVFFAGFFSTLTFTFLCLPLMISVRVSVVYSISSGSSPPSVFLRSFSFSFLDFLLENGIRALKEAYLSSRASFLRHSRHFCFIVWYQWGWTGQVTLWTTQKSWGPILHGPG